MQLIIFGTEPYTETALLSETLLLIYQTIRSHIEDRNRYHSLTVLSPS
jgi:hypothetical protein